jgi:hypothetical protein
MIRKLILGTVAIVVTTVLLFGRSAWSYLRTSANSIQESVQNGVPVEFQIDRARSMVKDLEPEVRRNMHLVAKEEVATQRLEEDVAAGEAKLAKEKKEILQLRASLASGKNTFQYAGRTYTSDELRTDLARRFERYKTAEATVNSLKEIRTARQRSVAAARQKLEGMLAAKRQLLVEVEHLEARNQVIAAAQTTSSYQLDETRLGQVKELVSNLRTRLRVAERLLDADLHEQIPLEDAASQDVVALVDAHFPEVPAQDATAK